MRRIVEVSGAGIFDRWSPSSDVEDFSRVNVIYGGNGSGKSSLARAFSSMAGDDHSGPGVIVEAMSPDGATRRVTDRSDAFWSRVRIFDKDFVKKNLLFDVGGRSEALPLLVLGEPNVDRDRRLTQIAERLAEVELEISRFISHGAHRIFATCDPRNVRSAHLLQRLGMTYEGRLREAVLIGDTWRDSAVYGLLAHDWSPALRLD